MSKPRRNQSLQQPLDPFAILAVAKRAPASIAAEPRRYIARHGICALALSLALAVSAQASAISATEVCETELGEGESASAIFLDLARWGESSLVLKWLLPEMAENTDATFRVYIAFKDQAGVEREVVHSPDIECVDTCSAKLSQEIGPHRPTVTYDALIYTGEDGCTLVYRVTGEIIGEGEM